MTIPRRSICPFPCLPDSSLSSSLFQARFARLSATETKRARALISSPVWATISRTKLCKTRSFSSVTTAVAAAWQSNIAASTSGRCVRKISSASRSSSPTSGLSGICAIGREYSERERNRSGVRLHRRGRKTLPQTQTLSCRTHQAHADPHRAAESQAECLHHRRRRTCSRASPKSRIGTFCAARPQRPSRPRPASWGPDFVEGQHIYGRHSHHCRLKDSERFHSAARREGRGAVEGSRRRPSRQDQHARVRLRRNFKQPALWPCPESVGPVTHSGRFDRRLLRRPRRRPFLRQPWPPPPRPHPHPPPPLPPPPPSPHNPTPPP